MYLIQYKHNMDTTIVLLHPFMSDKHQSDKIPNPLYIHCLCGRWHQCWSPWSPVPAVESPQMAALVSRGHGCIPAESWTAPPLGLPPRRIRNYAHGWPRYDCRQGRGTAADGLKEGHTVQHTQEISWTFFFWQAHKIHPIACPQAKVFCWFRVWPMFCMCAQNGYMNDMKTNMELFFFLIKLSLVPRQEYFMRTRSTSLL